MEKMKTRLLRGLSAALNTVANSPKISHKLCKAKDGLKRGQKPELCPEGINGTYFMKNEHGVNIGVFKPSDEELDSENNPKLSQHLALNSIKISAGSDSAIRGSLSPGNSIKSKFNGRGVATAKAKSLSGKKGTPSLAMNGVKRGEEAVREVAAYLVDKKHHFYGVPSTTMIKLACPIGSSDDLETVEGEFDSEVEDDDVWMRDNRKVWFKMGSFQEFVESDGCAEDIGVGVFPSQEVHKIGILDLHIFNTDRHDGNILYKRNSNGNYTLTPIDHGLSLPHTMDQAWFCWVTWPQSQVPFDEAAKRYILEDIDVDKDIEMLRSQLSISEDSLRIMKISVMLLKKCVAAGMTLRDIGMIASRSPCEATPSNLEMMVMQANAKCNPSSKQFELLGDGNNFFDKLSNVMDEYISSKMNADRSVNSE